MIESRFDNKGLEDVSLMKNKQNNIIKEAEEENLQAKLDLMEHIRVISDRSNIHNTNIKSIRKARQKERLRTHTSFMEVGEVYE